jgi:STE24 endopeptidase
MSPQIIFIILLTIIVADFILESWLEILNLRNLSEKLPDELKDIYDSEKYVQSQNYERINIRFGLITSTFNLILILGMFFLDGFAWVDSLAAGISAHPVLHPLIFFGILGLAFDLLNTPFAAYDTFVIEQRFGFNKTTPLLFITDKLKGWLLSAVIGGGLMALIIWFYLQTTVYFWLWAWLLILVFMLFMAFFYSSLIVPLFNKQKLLEDGDLKFRITSFAERAGFCLDKIYTIDGSKRSTKANAYFSGLGRKKRIVLFDTLIKELSTDEIVAVLMHEIGHYRKKHIISGMILSFIQSGILLFILSLFVSQPVLSQALGAPEASFHLGLIAFGVLFSPISIIIGLMMNSFSRKNEFQADDFAAGFGMSNGLISALKKLSVNNLSNLTPHPLYVFFHYSHPTLLQRIRKLNGSI